jgi:hypothetical protein
VPHVSCEVPWRLTVWGANVLQLAHRLCFARVALTGGVEATAALAAAGYQRGGLPARSSPEGPSVGQQTWLPWSMLGEHARPHSGLPCCRHIAVWLLPLAGCCSAVFGLHRTAVVLLQGCCCAAAAWSVQCCKGNARALAHAS